MGERQGLWQALLFTIFVLGGSLIGTRFHSSAETVAVVRPDPADVSIAPGKSATVTIWIEDVVDLYGAQIHLRFDPSIIEIQDADPDKDGVQVRPGEFLDPAQGFVAANRVDNEAGEVLYGITLLSPASPVNGSDALIWIDFVALAVGRSEWVLQEVILATQDGVSIPVKVETGWVVVEDGQITPSSPTSTPAATETPAAPVPSPSAVVPGASPTPTAVAGATSLPTAAPSRTDAAPTDGAPEDLTGEPGLSPTATEAAGTEQATQPASSEEAISTATPTDWPTLAVPTRAPGSRTTPEAQKSGLQAALPSLLVFASAAVVFAAGLALYRWRKRQHQR